LQELVSSLLAISFVAKDNQHHFFIVSSLQSDIKFRTDVGFVPDLMYTGCKIYASLSYVTVRGEVKMERARGSKTP
jgi:hypothetical protein